MPVDLRRTIVMLVLLVLDLWGKPENTSGGKVRLVYCHTNFSWKLFKIFSLVKAETIRTLDFKKYSSDYDVMLGCQVSIHRFSYSQSKIIYGLSRLS